MPRVHGYFDSIISRYGVFVPPWLKDKAGVDKVEVSWDGAREMMKRISEHVGEYAGMPTPPAAGVRLVIHPKYKWALLYAKDEEPLSEEEASSSEAKYFCAHVWRCHPAQVEVLVFKTQEGRARVMTQGVLSLERLTIRSLEGVSAWDLAAELKAMQKLCSLVSAHQFNQYILTGSFLETSKRSRHGYLFQRLRPTLVWKNENDISYPFMTLCLHPIGYYEYSFAGVMVPTDDVIAHLVLMRGDEPGYWKTANQVLIQDTAPRGNVRQGYLGHEAGCKYGFKGFE